MVIEIGCCFYQTLLIAVITVVLTSNVIQLGFSGVRLLLDGNNYLGSLERSQFWKR